MCFFYKLAIIFHAAAGIRILDNAGKDFGSKFQFFVVAYLYFHSLRNDACLDDCQILWENAFVHKQYIGAFLLLVTAAKSVHHGCRFCCCCRFIQQGAVGKRHSREVGYHGLEVQQRFQASLRNFCLIRSIRGVPCRIFKHIALDNGRSDGVIPAHADIRGVNLV